ncbi:MULTISPECIES: MFS transporter [Rhizobium]|nr:MULTISPECIES: MFS transporter [Rhizobium]MBB3288673.1 MFS family permease [Rhizobium sp. BK252]MBB3403190.1 MFS family permease [Rhizobium sp. BK289]MBB3415765.1 MFS family permease [Rhizobium sp. BK284]MBB3483653.1 MFS family permease [Rhizobium sp. BK347]
MKVFFPLLINIQDQISFLLREGATLLPFQPEIQMKLVRKEPRWAGANSSLAVLLTGNFVTILDLFIVNVALPNIQRDLHASNAELQMIMVAYSVSYGAMLLNGARLGDLYGRRRLFLYGMAIFAGASLLCGLASSPWNLIAARALQGIGAALLMPQVYASLRLLFDGEKRRWAFGVMGSVQGAAGVASQVLGGGLMALDIGGLGWRLIFFVNLPVAAYAIIAGKWFIVETREAVSARLDVFGAFLGASALTAILLPAMIGREQHWPWWTIIGLLSSVPLFATFIVYENRLTQRGGVPIIDPLLFKNDGFAFGMLASFLFFSAISSFSLSLTIFLQVGLGRTPLQAAMLFLPSTIAFFAGSLMSAFLAKRMGHQTPIFGMAIFSLGLLIAVADGFLGREASTLTISVILQGLGQGIVIPLLLNMVLSTIADSEVGMASGIFSTIQTTGSAFGLTIVGIILFGIIDESGVEANSAVPAAGGYGAAFAVATLYNLAAVTLSLVLFDALHGRRRSSG